MPPLAGMSEPGRGTAANTAACLRMRRRSQRSTSSTSSRSSTREPAARRLTRRERRCGSRAAAGPGGEAMDPELEALKAQVARLEEELAELRQTAEAGAAPDLVCRSVSLVSEDGQKRVAIAA